MAFTDSHDWAMGRWCSRTLLSTLILACSAIQLYIPHRDDIFAEQLAGDLIVEQQHMAVNRAVSRIVEKRVLRNESSHGMAQDLAASGVELPPLTTSGRWKSSSFTTAAAAASRMPTRYTER